MKMLTEIEELINIINVKISKPVEHFYKTIWAKQITLLESKISNSSEDDSVAVFFIHLKFKREHKKY